MTKGMMLPMPRFSFPPPARQVYIHNFLEEARQSVLHDAVRNAAAAAPPTLLRKEIAALVPPTGLQILQGTGVRDELVFATPAVITHTPSTLGYYRLLIGASRKRFYKRETGLSIFYRLEDRNEIPARVTPQDIRDFCGEINVAITELIAAIPVGALAIDVDQLPLMTLGAQADGSWRTRIGQEATTRVFDALKDVVRNRGLQYVDHDTSITVVNRAGRNVTLSLAPDPDVVIKEDVNGQEVFKTAIEIKGGTDSSNIHNRAGEAEKSHRKAHGAGAQDFWTVISMTGADRAVLQRESPTTRQWFDLEEVLGGAGPTWTQLVNFTIAAMGI